MNPLTQYMNAILISYSIQWYNPSRIYYRLAFTTINYLDQHPKFLAYWMVLPLKVSNVQPFGLTITCLLLEIYSSIQVLVWQLLKNSQHSHQPSITLTSSNQNKRYYLFGICPMVLLSKYYTWYIYIYNLHSSLTHFAKRMVNTIECSLKVIQMKNIKLSNSVDGDIIGTVPALAIKNYK